MQKSNLNTLAHRSKTLTKFCSLLVLITLLASCGGGGGSSDVGLQLSVGAIVSTQAVAGGGMIYGQSSTGEKWAEVIPQGSTSVQKILNNGTWSFQVIAWEGPNKMSGAVRCAKVSGVSLAGAAVDVPISLNSGNCAAPEFSNQSIASDGLGLAPFRLVSCSSLDGISSGSQTCDSTIDNIGMSSSFKVVMMGKASNGGRVEGLVSDCITHANLREHKKADSVFLTQLRIPVGASLPNFDVRLKGYDDKNCTNFQRNFDFETGIGNGTVISAPDNKFTSIGNVDHIVLRTTNPYGSGSYSTTQSNYMQLEVKYYAAYDGTGCDCSALPPSLQAVCNQD